ncbi:MAG: hypothetical protein E7545_00850 [Ruminococcaceae bacterium]|nr:hypothetical protein [Oscillospiraceae bacterium]
MKKAKNIVLLIGIILNLLYILLQLFRFVYDCVTVVLQFGFDNLRYFVYNDFFPSLITVAIMLLPVILLILNLKNKAGKVLPIISAVMCGAIALWMVFSFITPAIPQYLIYSKLGLVDTYFTIILHFITSGGILLFTGFALLTVGSIMSLIKSKE